MILYASAAGRSPQDALDFLASDPAGLYGILFIGEDLDGKILLWNEGARRLYGFTAEEVLGKAAADILHPPEEIAAGRPELMRERPGATENGKGCLTRVRSNGERFPARTALRRDLTPPASTPGIFRLQRM